MAKLKITKTRTGAAGYEAGATIMVDRYAMTTQIPTGTYVGGTGGYTAQTGRQIQPTVKVGSAGATTGSIVTQKGAHKFQVADENAGTTIVAGKEYRISTVGTTDWTLYGGPAIATTNEIFSAINGGTAGGSGQVQNVSVCTLVNLATPTAANTMSIVCTVANVSNANIANIGATGNNRTTAYITWNAGDVGTGGTTNFEVGQTINLTNSNVTGVVSIATINSTSNLTVTLATTQTVPTSNLSAFTSTFQASKISSKYAWDFLNGGTAESSTTGGFTGANNPNRFRYHLAAPTDTFIQVAYA
jgi:P2-related tail formation protein